MYCSNALQLVATTSDQEVQQVTDPNKNTVFSVQCNSKELHYCISESSFVLTSKNYKMAVLKTARIRMLSVCKYIYQYHLLII